MLVVRPYDRRHALEYARTWALSRNPLFYNYTGIGGDCTNFVSQCVFAGSCEMNFTPVFGWYYLDSNSRTASWTGVEFFYNFMTGNTGVGPYGAEIEESGVAVGDVVQLQNAEGQYYHTLFVSGFSEQGEILVAAHSDDALDRPLSTYEFASARYIGIRGVRFEIDFSADTCFSDLLGGIAIIP